MLIRVTTEELQRNIKGFQMFAKSRFYISLLSEIVSSVLIL